MLKQFYIAAALFSFVSTVEAADFRSGASVVINTPQMNDVYIAAGKVVINAPVYGDVIVAGGEIIINDSVMADILIAGGEVSINGYVGDDVRCMGGSVSVAGHIAGDLVMAGGTVIVKETARVSSITASGGHVEIAGESMSDLTSTANELILTGKINGDVIAKGAKIEIRGTITGRASLAASTSINISKTARIGRGIQYWLPFDGVLQVPKEVTGTKPVFNPLLSITHSRWYFLGASTFLGLLWYIGMAFTLILITQYLFSATLYKSGTKIHSQPIRSFLLGIGYFIVVPLTAVILLITIVGLPLTILSLVFYSITILLATIISSVVIANWVSFVSKRDFSLLHMSGVSLFTFCLLKIITFTPFFGAALMVVIAATCFGAIISSVRWKQIKVDKTRTYAPPPVITY